MEKDKTLYKSQVNQIMEIYPICEKDAKKIVDDYIKIYELDMTLIEFGKMIIDMGRMGFSASEAGNRLRDVLLEFESYENKHVK